MSNAVYRNMLESLVKRLKDELPACNEEQKEAIGKLITDLEEYKEMEPQDALVKIMGEMGKMSEIFKKK